jgi:bifunctional DNA-binding transcriptional regulator/antitoxin component of YhaV-PrlF toxin-antitoxin module
MALHDRLCFMNGDVCTLTERGQISMPASLRRKMHLKAGQKLRWEPVSETEVRIIVEANDVVDPLKALGFGRTVRCDVPRRTAEWMREIRDGE